MTNRSKDVGPDEVYVVPGPPCWGLGVRLTIPRRKENVTKRPELVGRSRQEAKTRTEF
jgi:hypothetical protein